MRIATPILTCILLGGAGVAPAADGARPPANAAQPVDPPAGRDRNRENLTPTQLTGTVMRLPEASYCMDGATHIIRSSRGDYRLKARTPEAARDLAYAAEQKQQVSLAGHLVTGPECSYLSVYSITRIVNGGEAK